MITIGPAKPSQSSKEPRKPRTKVRDEPIAAPFVVLVDHRERGAAYTFAGLKWDADRKYRPVAVSTSTVALKTGDYTIAGLEKLVTVERKSLSDLYLTLSKGRDRFRAEHERMQAMVAAGGFACVMIEASGAMVEGEGGEQLAEVPPESQFSPKAVVRTELSWTQRYGIPWIWAGDRRSAEIRTFRILESFWNRYQRQQWQGVEF